MTYIKPQEVRSPKNSWRLTCVLHDGGIGEWSAAEGRWARDGRWRDVLAIRWNGGSSDRGIGSPQSHGLPTWFIVPDEMEAAMRSVIESVAERMAYPFSFFISADWSKEKEKRSVHIADLRGRCVRYEKRTGWTLKTLLDLAREQDGPVLVGVDAALGVPDAYWREVLKTSNPASFIEWLRGLDPDFFEETVRSAAEWRVDRPFFHVPRGAGSLKAYYDRLPGGFLREIDRRTGAKPIFAASGIPGTVGSGTRALWRELAPLLREERDFAVWPFEEDLADLASRKKIVLVEIYPMLAYAAALAEKLPAVPLKVAKTKTEKRKEACDRLEKMDWVRDVDLGDLRIAREDENAFDSLFVAAAVLRCTFEGRALFSPYWIDRQAEGGMLFLGPVDPVTRRSGEFPGKEFPGASNDDTNFPIGFYQGYMAAPLEAPAARRERLEIPERLAPFIRSKDLDTIGASEAAERLKVSRTTVYHWATRKKLLAWTSAKRGLTIPAAQILGSGMVVPGISKILDVIDDPELAWAFLTQDWPFANAVARPLDKLACGQIDEVVNAAPGFGTTFT